VIKSRQDLHDAPEILVTPVIGGSKS